MACLSATFLTLSSIVIRTCWKRCVALVLSMELPRVLKFNGPSYLLGIINLHKTNLSLQRDNLISQRRKSFVQCEYDASKRDLGPIRFKKRVWVYNLNQFIYCDVRSEQQREHDVNLVIAQRDALSFDIPSLAWMTSCISCMSVYEHQSSNSILRRLALIARSPAFLISSSILESFFSRAINVLSSDSAFFASFCACLVC